MTIACSVKDLDDLLCFVENARERCAEEQDIFKKAAIALNCVDYTNMILGYVVDDMQKEIEQV